MKRNTKILAYLSLLIVVITWGLSPIIGKYMLNSYSPGIKRLLDAVFAAAALGLLANKKLCKVNKDLVKFSLIIGLCFSLAMILEGVALFYTTPAKSTFYGNVTCITVPIFVALFTGKLPNFLKVLAGAICLIGFGIIVFGDTLLGGLPAFSFGDGLTLVSGLFYGATMAAIGTWGKDKNSLLLTFLEFCITIPICAGYVLFFEKVTFSWSVRDFLIVAAAAMFIQGVCWFLRNFAVRYIDAGFVAIFMSFSTVVSGVVSVLVGMDPFSWSLAIGGIICVIAAILSGLSGNREKE